MSLCRTRPGLGPVTEKSPLYPMLDSNARPPDFVPAALTIGLRQPVVKETYSVVKKSTIISWLTDLINTADFFMKTLEAKGLFSI